MRATRRLLLGLFALLPCLAPTIAHAAWPHDPANGNVAVCTANADQLSPCIVPDGSGGTIIAWSDSRSGTSYDIYAQHLNAAGVPTWTSNGVAVCTAPGSQQPPRIVSDGAGGAILAWDDPRSGAWDTYAQRLNSAGVPQWTANGVAICTAAGDQINARLVADGSGGAILTWSDGRVAGTDIYAQRVNASGVPQWTTNGVGLCTAANSQTAPAIVSDAAGGAIVAWQDLRGGATYDIYAQRVDGAGTTLWAANGVPLCLSANDQGNVAMIPDGAGGAIAAWNDLRSGSTYDVYAQRVAGDGVAEWTANGVVVSAAASDQIFPAIASDGSGGAVVGWQDIRSTNYDVFAQRVSAEGLAQWTTDGVALCTAANNQQGVTMLGDGAGGAVVAWYDFRSGSADIYAQRVNGAGATQWTSNGAAVCTAASNQYVTALAMDGNGGAILTWYDYRNVSDYDVYAQRIDRFGQLGSPEPAIASVKDVPNDQGGLVKVSWLASYLDAASDPNLASYDVYRSAPGSIVEAAVHRGARLATNFGAPLAGQRTFVAPKASANLYAWEYLGSVAPAHFLSAYGFIAPTTGDSIAGSNPRTIFMVVGRNGSGSMYWLSAPDSGYSVDNIGPATPAPFTGEYAGGATTMHWGASHESDFDHYVLYRGTDPAFVPGPASFVAAPSDTGFVDHPGTTEYYKLAAVDVHGNTSGFALLRPTGVLDVPSRGVATVATLEPARPNPVVRDAEFRFALPRETRVTLRVFDQQGRRVRELSAGVLSAGEHTARWDGRDESGRRVASGIYFCRLDAGGATVSRAFVAVH